VFGIVEIDAGGREEGELVVDSREEMGTVMEAGGELAALGAEPHSAQKRR
jgi:hypothetical protein